MKRYITFPVNGKPSILAIEDGEDELAALQGAVGGMIAPVDLPNGYTVYVDDEGILEGKNINPLISTLAQRPLFGDAVMVGELDEEGNTASVSDEWLDLIRSA